MSEGRRLRPAGRRSSNSNLEAELRSRQTPTIISAPICILGAPGTRRKTLALRFSAMTADGDRLPREDGKTFYNSFHDRSRRYDTLRSVSVHIMSFICPPPTRELPSLSYRAANRNAFCCLLFLFDVTDRASFSCARVMMRLNTSDRTKFLVGSKCDQRLFHSDRRNVPRRDINRFLRWRRRLRYFEISARTRENVQSLLEAIQDCALQRDYVIDLD